MRVIKFTVTGLVFLGSLVAGCATNQLTPQDETSLGVLSAEVALCNAQPDPKACKANVKAQFDAAQRAKFDGGFVAPDAGGAL